MPDIHPAPDVEFWKLLADKQAATDALASYIAFGVATAFVVVLIAMGIAAAYDLVLWRRARREGRDRG